MSSTVESEDMVEIEKLEYKVLLRKAEQFDTFSRKVAVLNAEKLQLEHDLREAHNHIRFLERLKEERKKRIIELRSGIMIVQNWMKNAKKVHLVDIPKSIMQAIYGIQEGLKVDERALREKGSAAARNPLFHG